MTRWTSTRSKGWRVSLSSARPVTRGETHWESDQPLQLLKSRASAKKTNRTHDVKGIFINASLVWIFIMGSYKVNAQSDAHCRFFRSHRNRGRKHQLEAMAVNLEICPMAGLFALLSGIVGGIK